MKTVTIMKIPLQTECNRLKAIFKISQRIKTQWTLMTLGPDSYRKKLRTELKTIADEKILKKYLITSSVFQLTDRTEIMNKNIYNN